MGTNVGTNIGAADVESVVAYAADTLGEAMGQDWKVPAGELEWTCWETLEHTADDLFAYAAQLGPRRPPLDTHVPFICEPRREGGPASTIFAEPAAGNAGLVQVLEASGAFLAAMVKTVPSTVRAHHIFGIADPEGFAAMGIVEVLVHMYDVTAGLGLTWEPDPDLCARVLTRLFPDVERGDDPWTAMLWATGRTSLPGKAKLDRWRWYAAPAQDTP
ncbi:hypothetical protein SAMN05421678_104352 [Actinopolymorpha cephalotaxi]|uniref:Mycothiol maleylpyruvate isomerase N-terminal domain-containing protein n=1 Tax=Actinopolymorpha cephalotaxi TaxID=504797 RepID=A0A1I2Q7X6_9ACTN|nr:hypothetical protein [Actinopolymorpha cephalotaxi]NYH83401.1 hypothetical protein [Actinopolymorpha cephalotaxi]SFG21906.1 hypothetical protein SAMN05421678_104352 [Actinopolymorpha cephalotaxi]